MPAIAVLRPLLPYADDLLRMLSRSSSRSHIADFHRSRLMQPFRVSGFSAANDPFRGRWNWNRTRLPLYGSLAATIPVSYVNVPRWFYEYYGEVQGDLPTFTWTQRISQRHWQNLGVPLPDWEMQSVIAPPRSTAGGSGRPPHESIRRRRDDKMGLYGAALTKANTVLRHPTELYDAVLAFQYGLPYGPLRIAQNLVFNHYIDYAVGYQARLLRKHVYSKSWYNLPVGLHTLSRLFPGNI